MTKFPAVRLLPLASLLVAVVSCDEGDRAGDLPTPVANVESPVSAVTIDLFYEGLLVDSLLLDPTDLAAEPAALGSMGVELLDDGTFYNPGPGDVAEASADIVTVWMQNGPTLEYVLGRPDPLLADALAAALVADDMLVENEDKVASVLIRALGAALKAGSRTAAKALCGRYIATRSARDYCADLGRDACRSRGGVRSTSLSCANAVRSRLSNTYESSPECRIRCAR